MRCSITMYLPLGLAVLLSSFSQAVPTRPTKVFVVEVDASPQPAVKIPPLKEYVAEIGPGESKLVLLHSYNQEATPTLTTTFVEHGIPTTVTLLPTLRDIDLTPSSQEELRKRQACAVGNTAPLGIATCAPITTSSPTLVIGTITATPNPTGFPIGSTTLLPGSSVVVGSTTVSLGTSGIIFEGGRPVTTLPPAPKSSVIVIGTITATPNPTGFLVGSTTLLPGSSVVVGSTTLSLGTSGIVFEGGRPVTTLPPAPTPRSSVIVIGTITATPNPTGFPIGSTTLLPGSSVVIGATTVSLGVSGIIFEGGRPVTTLPTQSTPSVPPPTQTVPTLTPTLVIGSITATPNPTGFLIGSISLLPGSSVVVGSTTVSLGVSGIIFEGGRPFTTLSPTTAPILPAPTQTNSNILLTTLSDESTTEVWAKVTITDLTGLTSQTIVTTAYIETDSGTTRTTTGPIYVASGGVAILHPVYPPVWPSLGINIINPIFPRPPGLNGINLKCPKILLFLCGSGGTSSSNNGPDVDPNDRPQPTQPKPTDPSPTTGPSSTTPPSTSPSKTTDCATSQTASLCTAFCKPTVLSGGSTTTTTCTSTTCVATTACSVTASTTSTIATASCSGRDCTFGPDGGNWADSFPTPTDLAQLTLLAQSILAEQSSLDSSIFAAESGPGSTTPGTTTPGTTTPGTTTPGTTTPGTTTPGTTTPGTTTTRESPPGPTCGDKTGAPIKKTDFQRGRDEWCEKHSFGGLQPESSKKLIKFSFQTKWPICKDPEAQKDCKDALNSMWNKCTSYASRPDSDDGPLKNHFGPLEYNVEATGSCGKYKIELLDPPPEPTTTQTSAPPSQTTEPPNITGEKMILLIWDYPPKTGNVFYDFYDVDFGFRDSLDNECGNLVGGVMPMLYVNDPKVPDRIDGKPRDPKRQAPGKLTTFQFGPQSCDYIEDTIGEGKIVCHNPDGSVDEITCFTPRADLVSSITPNNGACGDIKDVRTLVMECPYGAKG